MVFGLPGFTAIEPIPRPPKTDFPYGPDHVSPPSVDLYRPTPWTQPLPHVLPSPVPTQSVFPVGSFGSRVIAPIELISNEPLRYFQEGSSASAFSVRQIPPPAGPIHMRQCPGWQFGARAMASMRLAA